MAAAVPLVASFVLGVETSWAHLLWGCEGHGDGHGHHADDRCGDGRHDDHPGDGHHGDDHHGDDYGSHAEEVASSSPPAAMMTRVLTPPALPSLLGAADRSTRPTVTPPVATPSGLTQTPAELAGGHHGGHRTSLVDGVVTSVAASAAPHACWSVVSPLCSPSH